ncbi:MAG TPA: bifunctional DNA-formamidopyrimidine glycosylase/DNA-(apurinic or apyrimidinic site) lyase [Patescibacteria group bacterium]|nr:bifunctional DNA-formamidopyrimidine glycosylase/DNA-(apurinic or apyrimidinic site) lyase [Patescibacteria group bacterium]
MPELPEVETIKIGLEKLIVNKTIESIKYNWPKSYPNSKSDTNNFVIGSKIISVKRRAKILLLELSSGYSLLIHLKMTGQLVYRKADFNFGAGHPTDSLVGKLPDKSTRVIIQFTTNSNLFFNDQRKFGWIKLVPTLEIQNIDFYKKFGPEPLSPDFTMQLFKKNLKRKNRSSIKAALLDQSIVAGIGNIYADESLWGAKIHPATLVDLVSSNKIKLLREEIINVLNLALKSGGSTDKNYVNAKGDKGSYLKFARVFRRQGLPCIRCNHIIKKTKVAGRGTHYCPYCQRLKSYKKL